MTRRDDVVQQLHLLGLQGLALRIALQHGCNRIQRRRRLRQQLRHRNRRLENQRRVNHIAKIQNAADRLAVCIHQQVARMAVSVDGLAAQAAQPRQTGAKGTRDLVDRFTQRHRFDGGAEFRQLAKPPHIPRQAPRQGWMKETLQSAVQPRQSAAGVLQQSRTGRGIGQQAPG